MENENKRKTAVSFKNGIHIHSDDEDIDVSLKGIHIETSKDSVHMEKSDMHDYAKEKAKKNKGKIILSISLLLIALVVYIVLGKHYGSQGWSRGWILFLFALVADSLFTAIEKKKPSEFAYAVLATIIFLLLGFFKGCWHPSWVVFLTIPVYYIICDKIQNHKEK